MNPINKKILFEQQTFVNKPLKSVHATYLRIGASEQSSNKSACPYIDYYSTSGPIMTYACHAKTDDKKHQKLIKSPTIATNSQPGVWCLCFHSKALGNFCFGWHKTNF